MNIGITPWNNDAMTDLCGEAFYIRDEESGKYWSPSGLPNPGKSNYHCIHGFGYSEFRFAEDGIYSLDDCICRSGRTCEIHGVQIEKCVRAATGNCR